MSGSNFCLNSDFHVNLGIFYISQIYDIGPTALLPLRRKACWGFFRPKNPTASAGFEPANLGTIGVCVFFLFNRTTLQVFVTYLTGALYVHPLWFYKHQHDNRVRSKLCVACQRWWFQWRFWFVPSVPGYMREEEEHKPDPWRNPLDRNHTGLLLCVACQRWWFQWRFWFVPSVPGYMREEEEHKPDPWRNPLERNHTGLLLKNEVASC